MPVMETVTIINKSGKVVSTGKHLVNIFNEAKKAYEEKKKEKKAEMKGEQQKRIAYKAAQNLIQAREDTESVASSRQSHRSGRSPRHHKDRGFPARPPLSHISEGSVASSRRSRSARPHSRRALGPDGSQCRSPYFEDAPQQGLTRRHTDMGDPAPSQLSRAETLPPPYSLHRSVSDPDVRRDKNDKIDMNLAYGELHHPPGPSVAKQEELEATMSKLDALLLEAHCVQHTATAIIKNLQSNPEAMAAVALTLAELSNILKTMGPGVLTALKASAPATFALLAAPEFLIAGGVALGVTIVMFGGYKIVKQIQAKNEAKKEVNRMEEAMVYDNFEMGSIENWRQGIADIEERSVATSVDGEFITPEAARQKKERIRERANEERRRPKAPGSVYSERSIRSSKTTKSSKSAKRSENANDIRRSTFAVREIPPRRSSTAKSVAESESGRSDRSSRKESKGKELVVLAEKKKKSSPLSILFNKHKDKKEKEESERSRSHRPRMIEV
ncbi:hypothetical protein BJ875DRAFT_59496 [Amylocarpus encephaloides]|uniref:Uncharacterized protein n=1 Tax=Amylocarpus encephaloides TaxID=45428 RepID=A0A9P7YG54_9HELO|nr:hypothetical protein BJ875DRAFT_59496 [Amylocarpus encephaloides]